MVTSRGYSRIESTLSPLALPRISLCSIYPSQPHGFGGRASLTAQTVKNLPVIQEMQEAQVQSLGQVDPLEREMATHSSILAWEILWTEELGGLQSMGLQRVGYDYATEPRWDGPEAQLPGPTCASNEQISVHTAVIGSGLNI